MAEQLSVKRSVCKEAVVDLEYFISHSSELVRYLRVYAGFVKEYLGSIRESDRLLHILSGFEKCRFAKVVFKIVLYGLMVPAYSGLHIFRRSRKVHFLAERTLEQLSLFRSFEFESCDHLVQVYGIVQPDAFIQEICDSIYRRFDILLVYTSVFRFDDFVSENPAAYEVLFRHVVDFRGTIRVSGAYRDSGYL